MSSLPLHHEPKLHAPDRFPTLADYNVALLNAVARGDKGAADDLVQNFAGDDYSAHRIARDG